MRPGSMLTMGVAVLFGLMAVGAAKSYLDSQRAAMAAQNAEGPPSATLVVASKPMRFGALVQADSLKEIAWAAEELPQGAFRRISDVMAGGEKRYALGAIAANEPIMSFKITEPGQRATLSTTLPDGKRAVTIRVNDVLGVAGFVLPGDRVDVMLTRGSDQPYVDILLQAVKVLAIDQLANEQADKANVVKTVTFEVDPEEAQKLALGSQVGTLSLALRNVAQERMDQVRRIGVADLVAAEPAPVVTEAVDTPQPAARPARTISVYRGLARTDYSVRN